MELSLLFAISLSGLMYLGCLARGVRDLLVTTSVTERGAWRNRIFEIPKHVHFFWWNFEIF